MDIDEEGLFKACFALAEGLMWEMETPPIERLPEQLKELSEMTVKFVELAKQRYFFIESVDNDGKILISAIEYLHAIAIPPLRGNYNWFDYSLSMLLELANPNGGPGKEGLAYFLQAREGIDQLIYWANENDVHG